MNSISSLPKFIRLIEGYPAIEIGSAVAIGDLHVGYEFAARENGIHIPSMLPRYKERILSISKLSRAKDLFILGDFKNSIMTPSIEESQEIFELVSFMKGLFNVALVPGNHDALLDKILGSEIKFAPASGTIIEEQGKKVALLHGHARPSRAVSNADVIIMAHFHFFIKYENGKYPIWLISNFDGKTLILMPPFNDLLPGYSIKDLNMQVPFFKNRVGDLEALTLNGYNLGRLGKLGTIEAEFD